MAAKNLVIIIGYLGRDPEVKCLPDGATVTNFSVAVTEKRKDKDPLTEWVNIVAWGKLADICGQYLVKGSLVYIEGKLRTRSWEKDGTKHYKTEVLAQQMQMLGGKGGNGGNTAGDHGGAPDDDVPF